MPPASGAWPPRTLTSSRRSSRRRPWSRTRRGRRRRRSRCRRQSPPSTVIFASLSIVTAPSVGVSSRSIRPPSAPLPAPPFMIEPPLATISPRCAHRRRRDPCGGRRGAGRPRRARSSIAAAQIELHRAGDVDVAGVRFGRDGAAGRRAEALAVTAAGDHRNEDGQSSGEAPSRRRVSRRPRRRRSFHSPAAEALAGPARASTVPPDGHRSPSASMVSAAAAPPCAPPSPRWQRRPGKGRSPPAGRCRWCCTVRRRPRRQRLRPGLRRRSERVPVTITLAFPASAGEPRARTGRREPARPPLALAGAQRAGQVSVPPTSRSIPWRAAPRSAARNVPVR